MSQHAEAKERKEQVTLTIGVAWRSETGDRVRGSAASPASQGAWSVSWRTEQTKERSLCSPAASIPGTPSRKLSIASVPEVKLHPVANREPGPILKWTRQTWDRIKVECF